jgi:hypothetical protein
MILPQLLNPLQPPQSRSDGLMAMSLLGNARVRRGFKPSPNESPGVDDNRGFGGTG